MKCHSERSEEPALLNPFRLSIAAFGATCCACAILASLRSRRRLPRLSPRRRSPTSISNNRSNRERRRRRLRNTPGEESQAPAQATPEHRITPEEAKELLNAVDEVLKFDSGDTGLRIKHEIKRQLADREQVQTYIEARLKDDEDTQRLQRSEVVLKKLGLLPRDFDLQTFLRRIVARAGGRLLRHQDQDRVPARLAAAGVATDGDGA